MSRKELQVEFNKKRTRQPALPFGFTQASQESNQPKKRPFEQISNEVEDKKEKSSTENSQESDMPVYTKFVFHKNGDINLVNNKKKFKENTSENIP